MSIAFRYDRIYEIEASRDGGRPFVLREQRLAAPRHKDYDAEPNSHPREWDGRFDVSG